MEVLFACSIMFNSTVKEIRIEEKNPGCRVYINTKDIGGAKLGKDYCYKLAEKVRNDLMNKGYKCDGKK